MLHYLSRTPVCNKRVLLRVDFNLPIAGGEVGDDYDIIRALPTLRRLLRGGNVLVILSHHSDERQSLAPLTPLLRRKLRRSVVFLRDPFRVRARAEISRASPGSIFLVENLRFWPGEQSNRHSFAAALAALGQVYINDAFGELHRAHASVVGLPRLLPAFVGPLVEGELKMLGRLLRPRRPFVVVIGGAKPETKLKLIPKLGDRADWLLLGGLPAALLLRAEGGGVSGIPRSLRALVDPLIRSRRRSAKLILPVDARLRGARGAGARLSRVAALPPREALLDIGPETVRRFARSIREARTILWNGPMGRVEEPAFAAGTRAIARLIRRSRAYRVVGGGDTIAFLRRGRMATGFGYVSTGGGAMLAYLAGEKLPGLEALKKSSKFKVQNAK